MNRISYLLFTSVSLISVGHCETEFIAKGSPDWRYLDTGWVAESSWTSVGYDDSGWKSGKAPLGYETEGAEGLATEVGFGGDEENKHAATFFRKTFEVAATGDTGHLVLSLTVDDGAVVYLNGSEVTRVRMADGDITDSTFATKKQSGANLAYALHEIPASTLTEGKNVLAISVHQSDATSSDIHVDAALSRMDEGEFAVAMFPEKMNAIMQSYNEETQAFMAKYQAAPTEEEKLAMRDQYPSQERASKDMSALIQSLPENPGVLTAASWIMRGGGLSDEIVKILNTHHAMGDSEAMTTLVMNSSFARTPPTSFLNKVSKENPSEIVQGVATYALAMHSDDEAAKEKMLDQAMAKVGDFKMRNRPLADQIKDELKEMRLLGIGKIAPEIEGEDIDGVAFKLSEYRGKVVVLDFWGHW